MPTRCTGGRDAHADVMRADVMRADVMRTPMRCALM